MQKIKNEIMKRLIKECNSTAIDMFLYICQYQNDFGQVYDLQYKDTCIKLQISHQTFYDALYFLEDKGFIKLGGRHGAHDVKVLDNIFPYDEYATYKEGYLDLKNKPFYKPEFHMLPIALKKGVITIANNMMNLTEKVIIKGVATTEITEKLTIGIDKIRNYCKDGRSSTEYLIKQLEKFFIVEKKSATIYVFKPLKPKHETPEKETGMYKFITFRIANMCSKNKIAFTMKDLYDTYYIFKSQYKKFVKIVNMLCQTVFEKKSLEPALINYLTNN